MTNGGLYFPQKLFFRKEGVAQDWSTPAVSFFLRKKVNVYNILTKTYECRTFDRKRIKEYQKEYKNLMKKLTDNYDILYKNLSDAHDEMTKRDFWNNYLELSK